MSKLPSLKQFITEEIVPEGEQIEITDDMDLMTSGLIDSVGVLQIVAFIEEEYDIMFDPEEIDPENLKTIAAVLLWAKAKKSKKLLQPN